MNGDGRPPFLNTNILVYLIRTDPRRTDIAERLLLDGGVVSVQVLNEIANVGRKKLRRDWAEITPVLDFVRRHAEVVPVTVSVHEIGVEIARRHRLSVYDSMILAAAMLSDCSIVYSEDMQHGQAIGTVRIIDPFRP